MNNRLLDGCPISESSAICLMTVAEVGGTVLKKLNTLSS